MPAADASLVHFSFLVPCRTPKDLKAPNLKRLYSLLLQISLHPSFDKSCMDETLPFGVLYSKFKVHVSRLDIISLSQLLFSQLHQRYKVVLYGNNCDQAHQSLLISNPLEDNIFLLKCCMIILPYLRFMDSILSDRSECLIKLFEKISSLEIMSCNSQDPNGLQKGFSMLGSTALNDSSSYSNLELVNSVICCPAYPASLHSYLCSILEVFIDELLLNRHVRQCFEQLENFPLSFVLEGISAHFLLCMSTDGAMDKFLHSLFCSYCTVSGSTVLSLTAALSIFSIPAIRAAPISFQAHVIMLATGSIRILKSFDKQIMVPLTFERHMATLECLIRMHNLYMSSIKLDCLSNEVNDEIITSSFAPDLWLTECQSNFHLCISSNTHEIVKDRIGGLVYSMETVASATSFADKLNILSSATSYILNNKKILNEPWQDDICMMLNCLIEHVILCAVPTENQIKHGEVCQQDLFSLAVVAKLMGCTLIRIVESMKYITAHGEQLLSDNARKRLNSVLKVINLFGLNQMAKQTEDFAKDVSDFNLASCTEIINIVMHFSRLLALASGCGHCFFIECCIFMLMAAINLLVFEEGNVDALVSFLRQEGVPLSKGLKRRQLSRKIGCRFEKIKKMLAKGIRNPSKCTNTVMTNVSDIENDGTQNDEIRSSDESEESWANGEAYFKSIGDDPDYSDLVDFVACKKEKDYSLWLTSRAKFLYWKRNRLATHRKSRRRRLLAKLFAIS